ncbi:MAG: flagellar protein FlaG [Acidobacteria bacterium]|nr:flagellar protein FlaG [Acidobacteriota bacterium]
MQVNATIPSIDFNPVVQARKSEFNVEPKEKKTEKPETTEPKTVDKTENLEKLKDILAEHNITLKFSQDSDTKELVVELVDDKTGEAVRQIPSQISLKLAAIFVKMQGQFVDKKQ